MFTANADGKGFCRVRPEFRLWCDIGEKAGALRIVEITADYRQWPDADQIAGNL